MLKRPKGAGGQRVGGDCFSRRGGVLEEEVQNRRGGTEDCRNRRFEELEGECQHTSWSKSVHKADGV